MIDFVTYENKSFGITIKYPQQWNKVENQYSVSFTAPYETFDNFSEALTISVVDWSPDQITLDKYTLINMSQLMANYPGININHSFRITLDNVPAQEIVYSWSQFRFLQIWAVRNSKTYLITFIAEISHYSEHFEIAKEMINSFRFTPDSKDAYLSVIK